MAIFTILAAIGGAIKGAGIATAAAAVANPLAAAALGTTVVSGGFSAAASRSAGKDRENQLERQIKEEAIAATGRELQRREELNRMLSARSLALSTSGLAGEGTPQSIALSAAEKIGMGEGMESLSDQLRQAQLKRAAKNARLTGNIQAASTLLDTGAKALGLMSDPGKSPKAKTTNSAVT
jgi:hypothetical protein